MHMDPVLRLDPSSAAHRPSAAPERAPKGRWRYVSALLVVSAFSGCATSRGGAGEARSEPVRYDMEPVEITATREGAEVTVDAYDAQELFERASQAYAEKRFDDALGHYRRLMKSFASSAQAKAAQYNLGLVRQDQGQWAEAAAEFRRFIDAHPESPDVKDAYFQLGISLAEAKQWLPSEQVFVTLIERKDLTADDRVEALTRRAVARYNLDDLDTAEYVLREVFFFKRRLEVTNEERLDTDYFLALAQLMLGEISHKRSNAVPLRWPESQMKKDLEEKARQLLEARRRYIDAVRYGNARIASMAAFQIGTLFQEFYDAVMAVPEPTDLGGDDKLEQRSVYRDELRDRLRIVLEKALRGHEHNLELFERLGVETEWVTKSREAIDKLRSLLFPAPGLEAARPDPKAPSNANDERPAEPPEPTGTDRPAPTLDGAAPERRAPSAPPGPARRAL